MAKKYIITVNGTKYEVVVEDANPNVVYTPAAAPVAPAAPVAAPAPVEAPAAAPAPVAAPVAGGERSPLLCPAPYSRLWQRQARLLSPATYFALSKL